MRIHALGGTNTTRFLRLAVVVLPALACSTSNGRRLDPADATTQEVRDDSDEIPCEPRRVLQTVCQQCHTSPTRNGAPFSLIHRSDVLAVRRDMIEQLEARRMPLTPVPIDPDDRQLLLDWLKQGAPAVSPRRCELSDAGGDADDLDGSTPTDSCADGHADVDAGPSWDGAPDAADAASE